MANGHILVISPGDAPTVVNTVLKQAGFTVDTETTVENYVGNLDSGYYDAIVLVERPHANLYRRCKHIRQATDRPLIVVSAYADTYTALKALRAGADFFLRKPFGPLEFVARIKALISRTPCRMPVDAMVSAAAR